MNHTSAAHIHKVGVSQIFIPNLYEFSKKCINVQKQFICFGKKVISLDQEFAKQFDHLPQPIKEEARSAIDDLLHYNSPMHSQQEQENIYEQDDIQLLGSSSH